MQQWQLYPVGDEAETSVRKELRLVEVEEPRPLAGQVLVRLRAASLNYRDLIILRGEAPSEAGRVPLSDGAGEVVAVGSGVEMWKRDDRVAGTFFRGWASGRFESRLHAGALGGTVDGALSQLAVFDEGDLVRLPK